MEKQMTSVFFLSDAFHLLLHTCCVIATGKIAMARYEIGEYFEMIGFFLKMEEVRLERLQRTRSSSRIVVILTRMSLVRRFGGCEKPAILCLLVVVDVRVV